MENRLKEMFKIFPTMKVKSILCFFYAELTPNIYQAHRLCNTTTIKDDHSVGLSKIISLGLDLQKMSYLVVDVG